MKKIQLINSFSSNQLLIKKPILYRYPFKESMIRKLLILTNRSKVIYINDYFWHTALLTIGKENYYKTSNDSNSINEIKKFYKSILLKKRRGYKTVTVVDQLMNLYTLLYLKYELLISEFDELIDEGIRFIDRIYNDQQIIPYRESDKNLILIDTLGMICPFLMRYSHYTGYKKYSNIAINQIRDFILHATDDNDFFPYHSYDLQTNVKNGSCQWGRGIGWMLIGIVDSMEYMDRNCEEYTFFKKYLIDFISILINYQDENGYFKCNIKDKTSHVDSSATAFIGYSIARAIEINVLEKEYIDVVKKCCNAIEKSTDNKGRVWDCSEDCGGVGQYSMKFSCNLANGISLGLLSTYMRIKDNN